MTRDKIAFEYFARDFRDDLIKRNIKICDNFGGCHGVDVWIYMPSRIYTKKNRQLNSILINKQKK